MRTDTEPTMGVSEYMNKHPKATFAVLACLVTAAAALAAYRMSDPNASVTRAFYTDDDGKSTFVDDLGRRPPFDHNGRPAVRAAVFTSDNGRTRFVGYLERYTPAALKKLTDADAARAAGKTDALTNDSPEIAIDGTEVKKPGETDWVSPHDRAGRNRVVTVAAPDGKPLDTVFP